MMHRLIAAVVAFLTASGLSDAAAATTFPSRQLLEQHCGDCHGGGDPSGGFDLGTLGEDLDDRRTFDRWVAIHDRIERREMPPPESEPIPPAQRDLVLIDLDRRLHDADMALQTAEGRAVVRRLTRTEYENSLRDLLALPELRIKEFLPPDGRRAGFEKVGDGLEISPVQLTQYLAAARKALDAAICPDHAQPEFQRRRIYSAAAFPHVFERCEAVLIECMQIDHRFPLDWLRSRPVTQETLQPYGLRVEDVFGSTSSVGLISGSNYNTRRNVFLAPHAGRYRLRCSTWSFQLRAGVIEPNDRVEVAAFWVGDRLLGLMDSPSWTPSVREVMAWLDKGERVRIEPETIREWAGNITKYSGPGLAVDWIEVEGPLHEHWPPESHRRLFGDVADEPVAPAADARRLLEAFLPRVFRRSVAADEVTRYAAIVEARLTAGDTFSVALQRAYTTALCSTNFLFRNEEPGLLDDRRLATRLALWLWNSIPDDELLAVAVAGTLREPTVMAAQVDRMLADPKCDRFVSDFLDQWLKLDTIDDTTPDRRLYPEVAALYAGMMPYVRESMLQESRAFFRDMLERNLSADHVVRSDFAMLNEMLARLYGIPGVEGSAIRRVPLPSGSKRGGFLTQAAVLKVSANGTTTSPVVRGAFVNERLLGQPIPPPPPGIPTIDPDTRGATTIRDQLAKHRSDLSCAGCHAKLDPPGFALEAFDAIGGHRDRYRSLGQGVPATGTLRGGLLGITYSLGPAVDPSGTLQDGRAFADVDDLRLLMCQDSRGLARNLLQQLVVYATGAEIGYADRRDIERMLDETATTNHGLRSIVHAIAASRLFQSK
jgi:mono/diheme cytochrome c family protein